MTAELLIPVDSPWIKTKGCCFSTAAVIGSWRRSGRGRRLRFHEGRMPGYRSAIPAVEWASASVLPVTQVTVMSEVTCVSAPRGGVMLSVRCCFAVSRRAPAFGGRTPLSPTWSRCSRSPPKRFFRTTLRAAAEIAAVLCHTLSEEILGVRITPVVRQRETPRRAEVLLHDFCFAPVPGCMCVSARWCLLEYSRSAGRARRSLSCR